MGSLGHGRIALSTQLVMSLSTLRLGASGSAISPMSPQPQDHSRLTEQHPLHSGWRRPTLGTLATLLSHVLRTLVALGLRMGTLLAAMVRWVWMTILALSNKPSTTLSPKASLF